MAALSLKLPCELVRAGTEYAAVLRVSRAEYIRRAIERVNKETQAKLRDERPAKASLKIREESTRINAEFSIIRRLSSCP